MTGLKEDIVIGGERCLVSVEQKNGSAIILTDDPFWGKNVIALLAEHFQHLLYHPTISDDGKSLMIPLTSPASAGSTAIDPPVWDALLEKLRWFAQQYPTPETLDKAIYDSTHTMDVALKRTEPYMQTAQRYLIPKGRILNEEQYKTLHAALAKKYMENPDRGLINADSKEQTEPYLEVFEAYFKCSHNPLTPDTSDGLHTALAQQYTTQQRSLTA